MASELKSTTAARVSLEGEIEAMRFDLDTTLSKLGEAERERDGARASATVLGREVEETKRLNEEMNESLIGFEAQVQVLQHNAGVAADANQMLEYEGEVARAEQKRLQLCMETQVQGEHKAQSELAELRAEAQRAVSRVDARYVIT